MQVGQRAFEIGRDILPRMRLEVGLEVTHDTDLGSNVQRARKGRQEIGFARQVEPQQAVPLQRQTLGTQRVGPRLHVAVGHELPVFRAAHGAFGSAPLVQQSGHGYGPSRDALQHGARDVVEREFDQLFYHCATICFLCRPSGAYAISISGGGSGWGRICQ